MQTPYLHECLHVTNLINTLLARVDCEHIRALMIPASGESFGASDPNATAGTNGTAAVLGDRLGCAFLEPDHSPEVLKYSIVDGTRSVSTCEANTVPGMELLLREITQHDFGLSRGRVFDLACREDARGSVHLVLAVPQAADVIERTGESRAGLLGRAMSELSDRQFNDSFFNCEVTSPSTTQTSTMTSTVTSSQTSTQSSTQTTSRSSTGTTSATSTQTSTAMPPCHDHTNTGPSGGSCGYYAINATSSARGAYSAATKFVFNCTGIRDDHKGIKGGAHAWQNVPTEFDNSMDLVYRIQYRVDGSNIFGVLLLDSYTPTVTAALPPGATVTIEFLVTDTCGKTTTYTQSAMIAAADLSSAVSALADTASLLKSVNDASVAEGLGSTLTLASAFSSASGMTSDPDATVGPTTKVQETTASFELSFDQPVSPAQRTAIADAFCQEFAKNIPGIQSPPTCDLTQTRRRRQRRAAAYAMQVAFKQSEEAAQASPFTQDSLVAATGTLTKVVAADPALPQATVAAGTVATKTVEVAGPAQDAAAAAETAALVEAARSPLVDAISAIVAKSSESTTALSPEQVATTFNLFKELTSEATTPPAATATTVAPLSETLAAAVAQPEQYGAGPAPTAGASIVVQRPKKTAVRLPLSSTQNAIKAITTLVSDEGTKESSATSAVQDITETTSNLIAIMFVQSKAAASTTSLMQALAMSLGPIDLDAMTTSERSDLEASAKLAFVGASGGAVTADSILDVAFDQQRHRVVYALHATVSMFRLQLLINEAIAGNAFVVNVTVGGVATVAMASEPATQTQASVTTVDAVAAEYTKAVVKKTIKDIEAVIEKVMETITNTTLRNVPNGSVTKGSADGSLKFTTSKANCDDPASLSQGSSSFAIGDMSRFCASRRKRSAGAAAGPSESLVTQGIQYDESPYTWTKQPISTAVSLVRMHDGTNEVKIRGLGAGECAVMDLSSNTYVPSGDHFLLLGEVHTLAPNLAFETKVSRSVADLGEAFHVVAEPFHLLGNSSVPYVTTTVRMVLSVTVGARTIVFEKNVTSSRTEITFRASANASDSRAAHTMQLIPASWQNVSCRDNASFVDVEHFLLGLPANATVAYNLAVYQTAVQKDVRFVVHFSHATCLYLDMDSTFEWSTSGCVVSPHSSVGTLRCGCSHMTPFAGDVAVSPNTVRYRAITASDIAGNPIIFIMVVLVWVLLIGLIIRAKRKDKLRNLAYLGPMELEQNSRRHAGKYQVTIRTGVRPGSGTTARVFIQLFGSRGKSREIHLAHQWRPALQRNFTDTFIVTTPLELGVIKKIVIRHDAHGVAPRWFVSRIEVTNYNIEDSLRIFFINNWLALDIGDGFIDRQAIGQSKEDAATFMNAFSARMTTAFCDKHTFGSIMFAPPISPFSKSERICVCALFLFGSMYTSAMFYSGEQGDELTLSQSLYVGFISALITVVPLTFIILVFKRSEVSSRRKPKKDGAPGAGKNRRHSQRVRVAPAIPAPGEKDAPKKSAPPQMSSIMFAQQMGFGGEREGTQVTLKETAASKISYSTRMKANLKALSKKKLPAGCRVVAWVLCMAMAVFASYTLLLFSFEWGQAKSLAWLGAFLSGMVINIIFFDPITILIVGLVGAYLHRRLHTEPEAKKQKLNQATVARARKSLAYAQNEDDIDQSPHVHRLSPAYQEVLRKRLERDNKMAEIIKALVAHILFFAGLCIVIYTGSVDTFQLVETVKGTLTQSERGQYPETQYDVQGSPFSQMSTQDDYWAWAEAVVGKAVHTNVAPVNETTATRWFGGHRGLALLGAVRMRQLRVKEDSCVDSWLANRHPNATCGHTWNNDNAYTEVYAAHNYYTASASSSANSSTWVSESSWTYSAGIGYENNLPVLPYYPGPMLDSGGFMQTVPTYQAGATELIRELKARRWTDRFTRAVITELAMYSVDSDVVVPIQLVSEFTPTGGVISTMHTRPFPVQRYTGSDQILLILADVVILFAVLWQLVAMAKNVWRHGWRSVFCRGPQLIQFLMLLFTLVMLGLEFSQIAIRREVLSEFNKRGKAEYFEQFMLLGVLHQSSMSVGAAALGLATIKFAVLLRNDRRVKMLGEILGYASAGLWAYLFMFLAMFLAFALTGTLLFGAMFEEFRSVWMSALTLFNGAVDMDDLAQTQGNDATIQHFLRLYFSAFFLVMVFYKMNMFVAVLNAATVTVHKRGKENKIDAPLDLCAYVSEQVLQLLGRPNSYKVQRPDNDVSAELAEISRLLEQAIDKSSRMTHRKKRHKHREGRRSKVLLEPDEVLTQEQIRQRREAREYVQSELARSIASKRTLYGRVIHDLGDLLVVADKEKRGKLSRKNLKDVIKRYDIFMTSPAFVALWHTLEPDEDDCVSFRSIGLLMQTVVPAQRQSVVGKRALGGWWLRNQTKPPIKPEPARFEEFVDANGILVDRSTTRRRALRPTPSQQPNFAVAKSTPRLPRGSHWGPAVVLPDTMADVHMAVPAEGLASQVPTLNFVMPDHTQMASTPGGLDFLKGWKADQTGETNEPQPLSPRVKPRRSKPKRRASKTRDEPVHLGGTAPRRKSKASPTPRGAIKSDPHRFFKEAKPRA